MASRDFLGRFGREAAQEDNKVGMSAAVGGGGESQSHEIELGLGLSLGGCFGADPVKVKQQQSGLLARSSSVASMCSVPGTTGTGNGEGEDLAATAEPTPPPLPLLLHRTSSLPTEYDEARFQRKAMQCQRRMAAKRKRLERRNSMNSSRSCAGGAASCRDDSAPEPSGAGFQLRRSQGSSSSSLPEQGGSADADAKSPSAMNTSLDNNNSSGSWQNTSCSLPPTPSSSSGTRPLNSGGVARDQQQQPPLRTLRSVTMRTASTGDLRKTMMEEMPMVFSRLDGPNARRVDGFLYKFGKASEVRIVCVCHGNFLTPAEFVRHAGGGADDLAHPLRHIIVNRQPSEFL